MAYVQNNRKLDFSLWAIISLFHYISQAILRFSGHPRLASDSKNSYLSLLCFGTSTEQSIVKPYKWGEKKTTIFLDASLETHCIYYPPKGIVISTIIDQFYLSLIL